MSSADFLTGNDEDDGTAQGGKGADQSKVLFALGRRVERLLLFGILLVVLSVFALSLATAHKQVAEDRSATGVYRLLDKLQADEERLTSLFQAKPEPASPSVLPPSGTPDQLRRYAETRKRLGLPPPPPPSPPKPQPKKQTYSDALDEILRDVAIQTRFTRDDLLKYVDSKRSPADNIKVLLAAKSEAENRPTSLWGIQTPRSLRLKYADLDFSVPYGTLLPMLELPLAILIVGWLGAIYVTRHRELVLVADITDYKLAFPHLLSFLPVDMSRFMPNVKQTRKEKVILRALNRATQAIIRSLVILLLVVPMIGCFTYSLLIFWIVENEPMSVFFLSAGVLVLVMTLQAVGLVLNEWIVLLGKQFYELPPSSRIFGAPKEDE